MKIRSAAIVLLFCLAWPVQTVGAQQICLFDSLAVADDSAERYYRTELYFGRSIPGGGVVSDEDWERFLAEVVTPRFPDGFTVLKGIGQYRDKTGRIITEPSQILVFLYSRKTRKESRARIEEIRAAYVKKFNQESVLRLDFPKSVEVSF